MIVITRNGKTTVVTGWRAWLVGAAAFLVTWLAFALLVFVWIGAALTIGIMALLALPALILIGLLQMWLSPRQM